jgi:hypothetical protein
MERWNMRQRLFASRVRSAPQKLEAKIPEGTVRTW